MYCNLNQDIHIYTPNAIYGSVYGLILPKMLFWMFELLQWGYSKDNGLTEGCNPLTWVQCHCLLWPSFIFIHKFWLNTSKSTGTTVYIYAISKYRQHMNVHKIDKLCCSTYNCQFLTLLDHVIYSQTDKICELWNNMCLLFLKRHWYKQSILLCVIISTFLVCNKLHKKLELQCIWFK